MRWHDVRGGIVELDYGTGMHISIHNKPREEIITPSTENMALRLEGNGEGEVNGEVLRSFDQRVLAILSYRPGR